MNQLISKIIEEAVDKTLDVLGKSAKQALYYHLEHTFGINRNEIAEKPEEFIDVLYKIFGPAAEMLEKSIVRELVTTGILSDVQAVNKRFAEVVKEIRESSKVGNNIV